MTKIYYQQTNDLSEGKFKQWYSLFILLILFEIGIFFGNAIGILSSIVFTDFNFHDILHINSPPYTYNKLHPIYIRQAFFDIFGLILPSYIYLLYFEKIYPIRLFKSIKSFKIILIAIILTFSFMFDNSILISWNANIHLPYFLKDLEVWARLKESELDTLSNFMTSFRNLSDFIPAFIVIVIIPSLGEELFWRGIVQNKLEMAFRNGHIAIWVVAIIFSFSHLQLFGFIPRMFLGVLFGYMYLYSRNLWYSIIAHIINNGTMLTMIYLYNIGITDIHVQRNESYSWVVVIIFTVLGIVSFHLFRRFFIPFYTKTTGS